MKKLCCFITSWQHFKVAQENNRSTFNRSIGVFSFFRNQTGLLQKVANSGSVVVKILDLEKVYLLLLLRTDTIVTVIMQKTLVAKASLLSLFRKKVMACSRLSS